MPSEHRLHPFSVIFAFLNQIRIFIVPGLLFMLGVRQREDEWWAPWMMLLIIPAAALAVVRYAAYRYRHEGDELVIRTGLIFRRERHIPYARIQNIDAVQNVLHRVLNVVEVKIETGGSQSAEATMSVLPLTALQEMRDRVFADRGAAGAALAGDEAGGGAGVAQGAVAAPAPSGRTLLHMDLRELLLCGFIENRGAVVIAAAFGLFWELGFLDRLAGATVGGERGRGMIRSVARDMFGAAEFLWERVAIGLVILAILLALVRVLSMIWAALRLYDFRLVLTDGDVRSDYGLLTHVTATVPLRRVQSLTIHEGPLHRFFSRVTVKAQTAGGRAGDDGMPAERESLAPLLPAHALDGFLRTIVGTSTTGVTWHAPAPGAFRREVKGWVFIAAIVQTVLAAWAGLGALFLAPLLLAWAIVGARQTIRHLGWAETDDALAFKQGWLWRRVVIVRYAKMQVVTRRTSLFDRRTRMANVHVDTAGGSAGVVTIPYVPADAAAALHGRLATAAAGTQFKW